MSEKKDFVIFFTKKSCHLEFIYYFCSRIYEKWNAVVAQLVEHWLPKPRVAGSSPVYRSNLELKTKS